MDSNGSPASEVGRPNLPVYRWLRSNNTVAFASFPFSNYEIKFAPIAYALPSRSPLPLIWTSVCVRDPGISELEFFSFASQIGPIRHGHYTQVLQHPSYVSATVTYTSNLDTYRCFEELRNKGYKPAILTSIPPTMNQMQNTPGTANQMQSAGFQNTSVLEAKWM